MKEELPARLGEREIPELVQDDEVHAGQSVREPAGTAGLALGLELVHEVDDVKEARLGALADTGASDADREMGLPGPGAPDEHGVSLLAEEGAGGPGRRSGPD